jgi:hypothetical protein
MRTSDVQIEELHDAGDRCKQALPGHPIAGLHETTGMVVIDLLWFDRHLYPRVTTVIAPR